MAITYEWLINQINLKKKVEDFENVVYEIIWTRKATLKNDENFYTAEYFGKNNFVEISKSEFIPYNELTKDEVIKWLENENNIDKINEYLNTIIDNKINYPLINLPLPWNN